MSPKKLRMKRNNNNNRTYKTQRFDCGELSNDLPECFSDTNSIDESRNIKYKQIKKDDLSNNNNNNALEKCIKENENTMNHFMKSLEEPLLPQKKKKKHIPSCARELNFNDIKPSSSRCSSGKNNFAIIDELVELTKRQFALDLAKKKEYQRNKIFTASNCSSNHEDEMNKTNFVGIESSNGMIKYEYVEQKKEENDLYWEIEEYLDNLDLDYSV